MAHCIVSLFSLLLPWNANLSKFRQVYPCREACIVLTMLCSVNERPFCLPCFQDNWVSGHQKGRTILDVNEARADGVVVASAGLHANHLHLQTVCHVSTLSLNFYGCQSTGDNRMLICWFDNTSFKPEGWEIFNKLLLFIHSIWHTVNISQQSAVKTAHMCAYHCAQLYYTVQHRLRRRTPPRGRKSIMSFTISMRAVQCASISVTPGRFRGFSPHRGKMWHRWGWNSAWRSRPKVDSSTPNFIPIDAGMGAWDSIMPSLVDLRLCTPLEGEKRGVFCVFFVYFLAVMLLNDKVCAHVFAIKALEYRNFFGRFV